MGRLEQCMETAPSRLVCPQKPSHPPKLETIREGEGEEERDDCPQKPSHPPKLETIREGEGEEERDDLNVEKLLHFLCLLVSKEKGMQLVRLSSCLANLLVGISK